MYTLRKIKQRLPTMESKWCTEVVQRKLYTWWSVPGDLATTELSHGLHLVLPICAMFDKHLHWGRAGPLHFQILLFSVPDLNFICNTSESLWNYLLYKITRRIFYVASWFSTTTKLFCIIEVFIWHINKCSMILTSKLILLLICYNHKFSWNLESNVNFRLEIICWHHYSEVSYFFWHY